MKRAKNKCLLFLCVILSILFEAIGIPVSGYMAQAAETGEYELGTGDKVYKYEQLLNNYQACSSSYRLNSIACQLDELSETAASENYLSIQDQYLEAVSYAAKLKETKNSYLAYRETAQDEDVIAEIDAQLETIDTQITQYEKTISSYRVSMTDAKLQDDISAYYVANNSIIQKETQNKLKNEFMKKCYSLIITKEQQDYYQSYGKYLKTFEQVEEIKYKKGITESSALNLAKNNLLNNDLDTIKNQSAFDSVYAYIQKETKLTDNIKISLPLAVEYKAYDLEQTVSSFVSNNASLLQLQNYIKSYKNYLLNNTGYTSYQQASLQIENYQLQYDERKADIRTFVKEALHSYDYSSQSLAASEEVLNLKIKQYNIVNEKLKHKKATELELNKAEYEKEAAEATYYQCCYNMIIWQNILENNLYNITP